MSKYKFQTKSGEQLLGAWHSSSIGCIVTLYEPRAGWRRIFPAKYLYSALVRYHPDMIACMGSEGRAALFRQVHERFLRELRGAKQSLRKDISAFEYSEDAF